MAVNEEDRRKRAIALRLRPEQLDDLGRVAAVRQQLALDRPPRRIERHAVRRRVPAGKQQQDEQQKTPRPEISHAQLLPSARRQPSAPEVSPPPQYSGSPRTFNSPVSKSYQEGLADRRVWEGWFEGLMGAYKEGAEFWASQRSLQRPSSCYGAGGQSQGDWTAGCTAAQRALGYPDIRRKSEPDYREGWNSY